MSPHDHSKMDHSGMDHSQMGHHTPHMMSKGSGGDMNMNNMTMMIGEHTMMKMYFHFSYVGEIVLFEQWKLTNLGVLIVSMIVFFIMALLYEGLKYYREYLLHKSFKRSLGNTMKGNDNTDRDSSTAPLRKETCPANDEVAYGLTISNRKKTPYYDIKPYMTTMFNQVHAIQTFLHIIQFIISYLLMLIFMTYNMWLCIAVTLGTATGYFIFGWRKTVVIDVTEHCH